MPLTVKVQQPKGETTPFINIPKDIQGALEVKKGDTLKFVIRDSGAIEIRKE